MIGMPGYGAPRTLFRPLAPEGGEPHSPVGIIPDGSRPNAWYLSPAKEKHIAIYPVEYAGDTALPGWSRDGMIVSLGILPRAGLRRLKPRGLPPAGTNDRLPYSQPKTEGGGNPMTLRVAARALLLGAS